LLKIQLSELVVDVLFSFQDVTVFGGGLLWIDYLRWAELNI
jgi:hypothetical protein